MKNPGVSWSIWVGNARILRIQTLRSGGTDVKQMIAPKSGCSLSMNMLVRSPYTLWRGLMFHRQLPMAIDPAILHGPAPSTARSPVGFLD